MEGKDFMSETRDILKKLLALFAAMIFIIFISEEAFATGVELSEDPSAETETEETVVTVDYSKLEIQVATANGLNEYDYTSESWSVLAEALENGTSLFGGTADQNIVTAAAKSIESAIAGLVRMDYSKLEGALNRVYEAIGDDAALYDVWSRINEAEKKAKPLLISGNQDAVDNASAELNALLDELETLNSLAKEPEVVIKEVEVEVPPADDYCNIAMHRTWPVLFFISLAVNIAMAAVIFFVISKKHKTFDNIPLVDYDIDEDIDYDIEDDDE